MQLTEEEILLLQDASGNGSLALKYIHQNILEETDKDILLEMIKLGRKLSSCAESVLSTHYPLSFGRKQ